jgi:hypothetical protein
VPVDTLRAVVAARGVVEVVEAEEVEAAGEAVGDDHAGNGSRQELVISEKRSLWFVGVLYDKCQVPANTSAEFFVVYQYHTSFGNNQFHENGPST